MKYRLFSALVLVVGCMLGVGVGHGYDVTTTEDYNADTMGTAVNITSTGVLTGTVPNGAGIVITGNGVWQPGQTGNVYYGQVPPNFSGFTGTIRLNNTSAQRFMPQYYFDKNLAVDVSAHSQVWIQSNKTVNWNFNLHDPNGMNDGIAQVRVDGSGTTLNGTITLSNGQGWIATRMDRTTASNTVAGKITGSGQLVYNVAALYANTHGTMVLTNADNDYTGGTIIKEGTLELRDWGELGAGTVEIQWDTAKHTNADNASIEFYRDPGTLLINRTSDYTFTNQFTGTGVIDKKDGNTLTFNSATTSFNGEITQRAGTIDFGTLANIGMYNYYGGTIGGTTAPTISGHINLYTDLNYSDVTALEGKFASIGSLTNIMDGKKVTVTSLEDLETATTHFVTVGTGKLVLDISTFEITDANTPMVVSPNSNTLVLSGVGTLNCATKTAALNVDSGTLRMEGGIVEARTGQNFTKLGAGTLEVASMSNTGKTTVSEGVLKITDTNGANYTNSSFQVDEGATLGVTIAMYRNNPSISGTGVIEFAGDSGTIEGTNNKGGFKGTIRISKSCRFQCTDLVKYDGVTFDISDGAQFWTNQGINLNNNFILSGTSSAYDGRGAMRFDRNAGEGAFPVVLGTVQLAGDTRISTIQGDFAGRGMIAGVISGVGLLEKNENFTIASNPLNARLILTGENTYSGGTKIATGTLQLGYSGTMNGKTYDGTSGTLGTGGLTIESVAALDYNRTNEYVYGGAITNKGTINVNSGTFITTGTITAPADTTGKINVAAGATYFAKSEISRGTNGYLNITLNGTADKAATLTSLLGTALANATILGNEYGVWNVNFTGTDYNGSTAFADASNFEGTINMNGTKSGEYGTRWRPNAVLDWSKAKKIVIGPYFEFYMKNTTISGNIELGNSTGHDSGAGIRVDGGTNNVLNGSLTLRDGETGVVNLKNNGGNLVLNSNVTGTGSFSLKGDNSNGSNVMTLTSDSIAYSGNTTVNNSIFKLENGARMQANGTITLSDATAQFIVNKGATLAVGMDDATTPTTLTVTGSGTFSMNGTLQLDMFGDEQYDILDLTGMNTGLAAGTIVDLVIDPNVNPDAVYTVNWAKGFTPNWEELELKVNSVDNRFIAQVQADGSVLLGSANALPEPSTWLLLILSAGMIYPIWRRKRV